MLFPMQRLLGVDRHISYDAYRVTWAEGLIALH
jgi:hypothetical protein